MLHLNYDLYLSLSTIFFLIHKSCFTKSEHTNLKLISFISSKYFKIYKVLSCSSYIQYMLLVLLLLVLSLSPLCG